MQIGFADQITKTILSQVKDLKIMEFRQNLRHGTLVGAFLFVFGLCWIRMCSWLSFALVVCAPILCYGLLGSRTFTLSSVRGKVRGKGGCMGWSQYYLFSSSALN